MLPLIFLPGAGGTHGFAEERPEEVAALLRTHLVGGRA